MAAAPVRLRCDFLENPLGIDNLRPQLSWLLSDERPAEVQTGWQIVAASEPSGLKPGSADLWDSGRVGANGEVQIRYGGPALVSRQRVWWAVQSFDSDGLPSGFSRPAFFEMGLLQPAEWHGRWIGTGYMGSRTVAAPVPMLVRDFVLAAAPQRARLYLAAAGFCSGEINGQSLGLPPMAPTASDYRQRVRYRTLEVTALLTRGHNRLGLLLLDGTFSGNLTRANQRQQFGQWPLLLAQLEVLAADGSLQRVCSDEHWCYRPSGWLSSDSALGEHFDARQQPAYWSRSPLGTTAQERWQPVTCDSGPAGTLSADTAPVLRETKRLAPAMPATLVLDEWRQPSWRYEFAAPIFGGVEVEGALESGQRWVVDYHSDLPGPQHFASDSYSSAGSSHCQRPLGVVRRFSGVTLSGDLDEARLPNVSGLALTGVVDLGFELETDAAPLEAWHQRLLSDLQAGCMGQPLTGQDLEAGLAATADLSSLLNLLGRSHSAAPLLRSWVQDLLDAEARRGALPRVVPAVPAEELLRETGSTEALAQTAWSLFRNFGDIEIVHRAYGAAQRLLLVMSETAPEHIRWHSVPTLEPQLPADLVGTAWLYESARLTSQMAGALGRSEDQTRFALLAEDVRLAFRRRFVTAGGAVVSRTQSALCLALGLGLLEPEEGPLALAALVANVRQEGLRVQTGQLSGLLKLLSRNGHLPLVLQLLATDDGCAQFTEHYGRSMVAAGALEWIYADLLGLELLEQPDLDSTAHRQLHIAPCLPLGPDALDTSVISHISGRCQTISGELCASWHLDEQTLALTFALPADTKAQLHLPGREPELLNAGVHERVLRRSEFPQDKIPKLLNARLDSPQRRQPG